jgi:hypothetical protein
LDSSEPDMATLSYDVQEELRKLRESSPLSAPSEPQERATDGTHHGNPCPSDECPCCTGEACDICDVSAVRNRCEHDVIERHAYPPETPATLEQQGPRQTWQPIEGHAGWPNYMLLLSPAHGHVIGAHVTGDVWHLVGVGTVTSESERPTHWMPLPDAPLTPHAEETR